MHVIELRADGGWTIEHGGGGCARRRCEVERAARAGFDVPPQSLGRHPCRVEAGALVIENRNVWDGVDRIDPATAPPAFIQTRVNRLGGDPVDWRGVRPLGWGRAR